MKKITLLSIVFGFLLLSCSSVPPKGEPPKAEPPAPEKKAEPAGVMLREKTGSYPFDLETVDLDGDGLKDLLIISHGGNALLVYKNKGNRKFELVQTVTEVGHHPNGLRAHDRDGDGRPDEVLVSCEGRWSFQIYSVGKDAKLTLSAEHKVKKSVYSLELGDLDGDGNVDAVMGTGPGGKANEVIVAYGATLKNPKMEILKTPYWRTLYPKIGDVDKDGKPDIVVMNSDRSKLSIFFNKGERTYDRKDMDTPPGVAREVELADLDWDGNLDYLLPFEVGKRALIIYNNGTGMESRREVIDAPVFGLRHGNVYRDDEKAVIGFGEEGRVFFTMKKRGETAWSPLKEVAAGGKPWRFRFDDFDRDGKLDVVFLNSGSDDFQVVWDVMSLFTK